MKQSQTNQTKWRALQNGKVTSQKFKLTNLYCYIANLFCSVYTKTTCTLSATLCLRFSQGLHMKVKPQGRGLMNTFTFSEYSEAVSYEEGLQNKWKVKQKKLGDINNLSQSIRYESRLHTELMQEHGKDSPSKPGFKSNK